MPRVFISYRHADRAEVARFLHWLLEKEFRRKNVFLDTSDLESGDDLRGKVERFIRRAHVMLIVIGPDWLDVEDERGNRRLDDPRDFLRWEIELGLKLGIPIIPVLVDGAHMPSTAELPASLKPLANRKAFEFHANESAEDNVHRLTYVIRCKGGQRRPVVRRPRLLLFHSTLILTVLSLILAVRAGLITFEIPVARDLIAFFTPSQAGPSIVFFQADSLTVVQNTPLTVRWAVEDAETCALYVDGVQHELVLAEEAQAILSLGTLGPHVLTLVATRGDLVTRATLQIQVDVPLQIRSFAASPTVLTRHIAREVTLTWDVLGATEVRLEGLDQLTGQVVLRTFAPQGSLRVNVRLEEQTDIALVAMPASGPPQRQTVLLLVEEPICIVNADQGPVYAEPGSSTPVGWTERNEIVLADERNADGTWVHVNTADGRHVWMPAPVLRCRNFVPGELPVVGE